MLIGVTGGGGYVGNVLVRHLLKLGHSVRVMDNFHKGQCDALFSVAGDPMFSFQYGSVTSKNDCDKFVAGLDGIIHLAAIVGFPACKKNPDLSKAVNVGGTEKLLAARKGLPFVFASTGSVYGAVEGVCTEESPLNPLTEYGIDKLAAERAVTSEENTVALRFSTGFGLSPCMRVNLLVNDFVYQATKNRCLTVFEPDARRTFIHVEDMAIAFTKSLLALANGKELYKVYNAGDNDLNWTKRQVAEYVKNETGCVVNYEEIGKDLDQRDYAVNFSKFNNDIMTCTFPMGYGIKQLIKAAPLLQISHQYE